MASQIIIYISHQMQQALLVPTCQGIISRKEVRNEHATKISQQLMQERPSSKDSLFDSLLYLLEHLETSGISLGAELLAFWYTRPIMWGSHHPIQPANSLYKSNFRLGLFVLTGKNIYGNIHPDKIVIYFI